MERAPHPPLMTQSPLAQLALALSTGVLASNFLTFHLGLLLVFCMLTSLAALVAMVKRKLVPGCLFLTAAVLFAGASLAVLEKKDVPRHQLKRSLDEGTIAVDDPVELIGVVDGPVDSASDRFYFTLRVERIRFKSVETEASGAVALMAGFQSAKTKEEYEQLELCHGAKLRVMTTLRRADSCRNPGVTSFTEYLDRKGYDATSFIKSPLLIERLDDEPVFLPFAWLYEWRQQLQRQIDKSFSPQTAGVLDAVLLGNRYNLLPDTAERFRAGGTFHVLVISGLHISFIGGVIFLLSQRLTKKRWLQFLLSALVLWGYTVAVGAESSVVRAALMFTIVALAPVIFRRASSLNALGGTALVLLVWRPQNLFDPSFQLTFLSVLAIVVVAWPVLQKIQAIGSWQPTRQTPYPPACPHWLLAFSECLFWNEPKWQSEMARSVYQCKLFKARLTEHLQQYRMQRLFRYVFTALVVSVSVQIVLLPFLIIYFHRISIASLVLNIGVSLIVAVLTLVAMAALLVGQFSPAAAAPLIGLADGLNWLMVHSVDPFARFGLASIRLPHYSGAAATVYWLYYLPLTILAIMLWRWNPLAPPPSKKTNSGGGRVPVALDGSLCCTRVHRLKSVALVSQIMLLGIIVFHPLSAGRTDGKLHVDFLDVGQGDSALVTMPDGTTLLIDGGGWPFFSPAIRTDEGQFGHDARSIGEAVVSEYLWWRGLDSVDYIFATHADADHIDGLNDVARNFRVRAALVARAPEADPEFQRFAATLSFRGIPLSLIGSSDALRFGGVTAEVLWPRPNNSPGAPSRNNDSVTLRLGFSNRRLMLTGDIESGAETAILAGGESLRVDLVKVAHHGSKTSSIAAFVDATQPEFAVISVGQSSMFGHPNKEVVERWKASGAQVLTTGRSGTITFITDGRDFRLSTFVHE